MGESQPQEVRCGARCGHRRSWGPTIMVVRDKTDEEGLTIYLSRVRFNGRH